jgi:hypothetical protein
MSEVLDARAQVVKLARLLDVEPESIAYMEKVGTEGLHAFRDQLIDLFYGNEDGTLKRFATVGNLLPSSVIASLTKEAVGPVLAARITGLIEPKQAISVVDKLPVPFVTDIAIELDPRRVGLIVGGLPQKTIAAIAIELVKRKEYVTMGGFVSFADEATLVKIFEKASDIDLLQIAFVTDDKEKLSTAISVLTDKRINSIIKVAGHENHWPEAIDLLRHMPDDEYFRLVDLVSNQDDAVLDELVAIAEADTLWEVVIPSLARMEDPSKPIAALLRADASVIKGFADAVVAENDWDDMRLLVEKLSEEQLTELRKRLAQNGRSDDFKPIAELLASP